MLKKILWYYRRIHVMGVTEIGYRLGEQAGMLRMSLVHRLQPVRCGFAGFKPVVRDFLKGAAERLPTLPFREGDTGSVCMGDTWPTLGYDWHWSDSGKVWNQAPDTGRTWSEKFFGSINYRPGNSVGDIRVAWEPARLQCLVELSSHILNNADNPSELNRSLLRFKQILLSWVRNNPLYSGIHYVSAMECGLRLIAVLHAVDMVRDLIAGDSEISRAVSFIVETHVPFIDNRLSLYSSAGNHTIAECVALVYAGSLFPEFPAAVNAKRRAVDILATEVPRQINPDGTGLEQANWYLCFISDLLGLALAVCDYYQDSSLDPIRERYEKGVWFLNAVALEPYATPDMGDRDDGYALTRRLNLIWDKPREERSFQGFPDGGITLYRDRKNGLRFMVDHGSLGMAPSYGHGHADALSLLMWCDEKPVLIDNGTYGYGADWAWRSYFRGTRAHNTIAIDDLDQSEQTSPFQWKSGFRVRTVYTSCDASEFCIVAQHDGYLRQAGVIHWRAVLVKNGALLVWDCLTGEGEHCVEINWNIASDVLKRDEDYEFPIGKEIWLLSVYGVETNIVKGGLDPIMGWVSPHYGERVPISVVNGRSDRSMPHEVTSYFRIKERVDNQIDLEAECDRFRSLVA